MLRWIFVLFLFPGPARAQEKRFHFTEMKMGSPFTIIFYHEDSAQAQEISRKCFAMLDSVNSIFSDYSPSSEISLLANKALFYPPVVSNELFTKIGRASCR